MAERVKTLIIGGGAIGLSIARSLARHRQALKATGEGSIMLIEKHSLLGFETSSRSSEVLHAGLYYPPKALKTGLCIEGRKKLIEFMNQHQISYQLCGKLVVATNEDEVKALKILYLNGTQGNGLYDLQYLDSIEKIHQYETSIYGKEGIFSPYSGIFDSHSVIEAMEVECIESGLVDIVTDCTFQSVSQYAHSTILTNGGGGTSGTSTSSTHNGGTPTYAPKYLVETNRGSILCDEIINTAGLFAPQVAYRFKTIPSMQIQSIPKPYYSKGNYFKLVAKSSASVASSDREQGTSSSSSTKGKFQRLIYPMPSGGGLGVHATIDLSGAIRFGPDTQWIPRQRTNKEDTQRDPYEHDLDDPFDLYHNMSAPNSSFSSRAFLNYEVSAAAHDAFVEAIARYWPSVRDYELTPDYCGIRPKLCGPTPPSASSSSTVQSGQYKMASAVDFVIHDERIHGLKNVLHLYGIESPGWTSSLALGGYVVRNYLL